MTPTWLRPTLLLYAACGVFGWLVLAGLPLRSAMGMPLVEHLVAAGVLVAAPLVIEAGLRGPGPSPRLAGLVVALHPLTAGAAVASMLLAPGPLPGLLASGWVLQSLLVAALGAERLARRGPTPVHELAVDAGHLYLPVGAAWLAASRAGLEPLGFDAVITALTAAHFHFAGLAAPAIAGQVGRLLDEPPAAFRVGALLVAVTPILVAVGILGSPILEVSTACLLALGVTLVAGVVAWRVVPRHGPAGWLLGAAQLVSLWTMALAVRYALGEFRGDEALGIAAMIRWHGLPNALAFATPSLVALAWLAPRRAPDAAQVPFPTTSSRGWVGTDWFDRAGLVAPTAGPRGLVSSLDAMVGHEFPGVCFAEPLRRYYEDSEALDLVCRPRWRPMFATPGRLYAALMTRLGQLVLPVGAAPRRITHRLVPLAPGPHAAGLDQPVGSVRAYASGDPMFLAVYGQHRDATTRYMNIHLPLPSGALHSVLRGRPLADPPGGLRLTSRREAGRDRGHEGLWLRLGPLALRLPLHEELDAWPGDTPGLEAAVGFAAAPGAAMVARHRFWLFGVRCLDLQYVLVPAGSLEDPGAAYS